MKAEMANKSINCTDSKSMIEKQSYQRSPEPSKSVESSSSPEPFWKKPLPSGIKYPAVLSDEELPAHPQDRYQPLTLSDQSIEYETDTSTTSDEDNKEEDVQANRKGTGVDFETPKQDASQATTPAVATAAVSTLVNRLSNTTSEKMVSNIRKRVPRVKATPGERFQCIMRDKNVSSAGKEISVLSDSEAESELTLLPVMGLPVLEVSNQEKTDKNEDEIEGGLVFGVPILNYKIGNPITTPTNILRNGSLVSLVDGKTRLGSVLTGGRWMLGQPQISPWEASYEVGRNGDDCGFCQMPSACLFYLFCHSSGVIGFRSLAAEGRALTLGESGENTFVKWEFGETEKFKVTKPENLSSQAGWSDEQDGLLEGTVCLKSLVFPQVSLQVHISGLVAKSLGTWRYVESLAMSVPILKHQVSSGEQAIEKLRSDLTKREAAMTAAQHAAAEVTGTERTEQAEHPASTKPTAPPTEALAFNAAAAPQEQTTRAALSWKRRGLHNRGQGLRGIGGVIELERRLHRAEDEAEELRELLLLATQPENSNGKSHAALSLAMRNRGVSCGVSPVKEEKSKSPALSPHSPKGQFVAASRLEGSPTKPVEIKPWVPAGASKPAKSANQEALPRAGPAKPPLGNSGTKSEVQLALKRSMKAQHARRATESVSAAGNTDSEAKGAEIVRVEEEAGVASPGKKARTSVHSASTAAAQKIEDSTVDKDHAVKSEEQNSKVALMPGQSTKSEDSERPADTKSSSKAEYAPSTAEESKMSRGRSEQQSQAEGVPISLPAAALPLQRAIQQKESEAGLAAVNWMEPSIPESPTQQYASMATFSPEEPRPEKREGVSRAQESAPAREPEHPSGLADAALQRAAAQERRIAALSVSLKALAMRDAAVSAASTLPPAPGTLTEPVHGNGASSFSFNPVLAENPTSTSAAEPGKASVAHGALWYQAQPQVQSQAQPSSGLQEGTPGVPEMQAVRKITKARAGIFASPESSIALSVLGPRARARLMHNAAIFGVEPVSQGENNRAAAVGSSSASAKDNTAPQVASLARKSSAAEQEQPSALLTSPKGRAAEGSDEQAAASKAAAETVERLSDKAVTTAAGRLSGGVAAPSPANSKSGPSSEQSDADHQAMPKTETEEEVKRRALPASLSVEVPPQTARGSQGMAMETPTSSSATEPAKETKRQQVLTVLAAGGQETGSEGMRVPSAPSTARASLSLMPKPAAARKPVLSSAVSQKARNSVSSMQPPGNASTPAQVQPAAKIPLPPTSSKPAERQQAKASSERAKQESVTAEKSARDSVAALRQPARRPSPPKQAAKEKGIPAVSKAVASGHSTENGHASGSERQERLQENQSSVTSVPAGKPSSSLPRSHLKPPAAPTAVTPATRSAAENTQPRLQARGSATSSSTSSSRSMAGATDSQQPFGSSVLSMAQARTHPSKEAQQEEDTGVQTVPEAAESDPADRRARPGHEKGSSSAGSRVTEEKESVQPIPVTVVELEADVQASSQTAVSEQSGAAASVSSSREAADPSLSLKQRVYALRNRVSNLKKSSAPLSTAAPKQGRQRERSKSPVGSSQRPRTEEKERPVPLSPVSGNHGLRLAVKKEAVVKRVADGQENAGQAPVSPVSGLRWKP